MRKVPICAARSVFVCVVRAVVAVCRGCVPWLAGYGKLDRQLAVCQIGPVWRQQGQGRQLIANDVFRAVCFSHKTCAGALGVLPWLSCIETAAATIHQGIDAAIWECEYPVHWPFVRRCVGAARGSRSVGNSGPTSDCVIGQHARRHSLSFCLLHCSRFVLVVCAFVASAADPQRCRSRMGHLVQETHNGLAISQQRCAACTLSRVQSLFSLTIDPSLSLSATLCATLTFLLSIHLRAAGMGEWCTGSTLSHTCRQWV